MLCPGMEMQGQILQFFLRIQQSSTKTGEEKKEEKKKKTPHKKKQAILFTSGHLYPLLFSCLE